jgi:hypothetical protein
MADFGAQVASSLATRQLADELEKRGMKVSGFPDDDARRLQVLLDAEWEATKAERMKEARAAALKKMELDQALARRKQAEAQLREEESTVASDEVASLLLRCVAPARGAFEAHPAFDLRGASLPVPPALGSNPNGSLTLSWDASPRRAYQVRCSQDLSTWLPEGAPVTGSSVLIPVPPETQRMFFRVEAHLPLSQ